MLIDFSPLDFAFVHCDVEFGFLVSHGGFFDQTGYFFKLIICVKFVVHHASVEDFCQVGVQIFTAHLSA